MADASITTAAVAETPSATPDAAQGVTPAAPKPAETQATPGKTAEKGKSLLSGDPKPETTLLGEGAEAKSKAEGEGDEKPEPNAPEEYADFTMPEGAELDSDLLEQFKPLAKELDLTQDQAQKLVDLQAQAVASLQAQQEEAYDQQVAGWREEVSSHPESKEMLSNARRALDAFAADPETRHFLTDTWLGDHPLMIKFLASVGKTAAEDSFAGSSAPPSRGKDARSIYHTMPNA